MLNKLLTMNKYKGIFPMLASSLSLIFSFVPVIYLAWIPKYQPVGFFLQNFALVVFFVFLGITAFSLLVRIFQRIMKKNAFFKWYDILFFFLMSCIWGGAAYNYSGLSYTKFPWDINIITGFYGFFIKNSLTSHNSAGKNPHVHIFTFVNFEFTISIALIIVTFTLFFVFLKKQKKKSALLDNDIPMAQ